MTENVLISIPIEEYKTLQKELFNECLLEILSDKTRKESNQNETYLTIDEVCSKLKISAPTLNSYTKRGFLKSYKIGSRVLYKSIEIDTAISSMSNSKSRTAC